MRYNRVTPKWCAAGDAEAMTIEETLEPVAPPLRMYEGKTLRITGTRIPLERVVYAFEQGQSPEEIIRAFPTLDLADVYAVIAYYLRNRQPVDDYVRQQQAEADAIEREIRAASPSVGFRERLLERRAQKP
jgi:uncharacterized protein (DUF433 family)